MQVAPQHRPVLPTSGPDASVQSASVVCPLQLAATARHRPWELVPRKAQVSAGSVLPTLPAQVVPGASPSQFRAWQPLTEQLWPEGQASPHPPQFAPSPVGSVQAPPQHSPEPKSASMQLAPSKPQVLAPVVPPVELLVV